MGKITPPKKGGEMENWTAKNFSEGPSHIPLVRTCPPKTFPWIRPCKWDLKEWLRRKLNRIFLCSRKILFSFLRSHSSGGFPWWIVLSYVYSLATRRYLFAVRVRSCIESTFGLNSKNKSSIDIHVNCLWDCRVTLLQSTKLSRIWLGLVYPISDFKWRSQMRSEKERK